MKIKKIYLDMDGVLANWCDAICNLHGVDDPYSNPAAAGVWDIEDLLGMTPEQLWEPADRRFWAFIRKCEAADRLVDFCTSIVGTDNVHVLTSPVRKERGQQAHDNCLQGKADWIAKHYPLLVERIIFAKMKEKYAEEGSLLIDDKTENVQKFIAAGGMGVLVPRRWNKDHPLSQMSHKVVMDRIENLYLKGGV